MVHRKGFHFDGSKGYTYEELKRQREAYDNYKDQPGGTNMRYKPVETNPYAQNVYVGPGSNVNIGTLRQLALQRVGHKADPATYNNLKNVIYTLNETDLRKRMADLERNGDFDMTAPPPEPDVCW